MGKKPPRIKDEIDINPGRSLDGPQPKKQRSCRPGQQPPINVPGQSRRRAVEEADEDEANAAGPSSFVRWGPRMERQANRWDERREHDVDALIATQPLQAAQQSLWRQAVLQQRQGLLDSTLPLPCVGTDDSSCCSFNRIGSRQAVFYGLAGVTGRLEMPVFECSVHGKKDITAHPLQFSCLPTAPVNNTKLLDVELVEEYRTLQLKDGVGGHGGCQQPLACPGYKLGTGRVVVVGCMPGTSIAVPVQPLVCAC